MAAKGDTLKLDGLTPEEILAGLPDLFDPNDVHALATAKCKMLGQSIASALEGGSYEGIDTSAWYVWGAVAREAIKYTEVPFPAVSLEY